MTAFSKALTGNGAYLELEKNIRAANFPAALTGAFGSQKALIIHALCENTGRRAIVLTPDEKSAAETVLDLKTLGTRAGLLPSRDIVFNSEYTSSGEYERQRAGALAAFSCGDCEVLVVPAEAAVLKTAPSSEISERSFSLKRGQELQRDELLSRLVASGYTACDETEGCGQFAFRGGIVDFFPPLRSKPLRIEYWGDELSDIAEFDPESQRRGRSLKEVTVTPAAELTAKDAAKLAQALRKKAKQLEAQMKKVLKEEKLLPKPADRAEAGKAKKGRENEAAAGAEVERLEKARLRLEKDAAADSEVERLEKARLRLEKDAEVLESGLPLCLDKYINLLYEKPETPLNYLSEGSLLFVTEGRSIKENINAFLKLHREDREAAESGGSFLRSLGSLCIGFKEIKHFYESSNTVFLDSFSRGAAELPVFESVALSLESLPAWRGSLALLRDECDAKTKKGACMVVFAGSAAAASALADDLNNSGQRALCYSKCPESFSKSVITVLSGELSLGLYDRESGLCLITRKSALFQRRKKYRSSRKNAFHNISELSAGDLVVHSVHGIGVFDGIEKLKVSGVGKDYLKIKYAKQDVLYVPVTQLNLVAKYIGPSQSTERVKLSRLGGREWENSKKKVRAAVADMAEELTELYAKRLKTRGFAFSPDTEMQRDFESRFEFEETEDQSSCTNEIKRDMERPVPMDRLLCGDVGFGKTEVALRAAFKCIADGKQCALLVPTTILAFQHYNTILKRFDGFPVECGMLSRFCGAAEQKKLLSSLKKGRTDMLVGTHRLISGDVEFKDLGLLIIDEEQRFGVAQKEKIKQKFPDTDVLTLSATPIPRTLNMAMTGIRDMSIIEEAPTDRHPVQTYVAEYDTGAVLQAIERELKRGGQVYYLYNNIDGIERCASKLRALLPQAKIAVAHGKMSEELLSKVWRSLVEGEIDVLVCTSIIETGIDVPNVNTLIVENADRLGLSQLHQIRGRIGRSPRRATAYLTFRRGKQVSELAEKRLNAVREYTEFGSGFKIAMRDLELRGAGSILGARQHGHMQSVGYDMYLRILSETVSEKRSAEAGTSKTAEAERDCLIDVQINAHIPEEYIGPLPQRLAIYRRIADISDSEDARDVENELLDRYGKPPETVSGLIEVALLRNAASELGIYEIGQRGDTLLLYRNEIDMRAVCRLSAEFRGRISVNAGKKPYVSVRLDGGDGVLPVLKKTLLLLAAGSDGSTEKI